MFITIIACGWTLIAGFAIGYTLGVAANAVPAINRGLQ